MVDYMGKMVSIISFCLLAVIIISFKARVR